MPNFSTRQNLYQSHLAVQPSSLLNRDELHVLSALLFDTMSSFYQDGRGDFAAQLVQFDALHKDRLFPAPFSPHSSTGSSDGEFSDNLSSQGVWDMNKPQNDIVKAEAMKTDYSIQSCNRKGSFASENNSSICTDTSAQKRCKALRCDKKSQGGIYCIKHGGGKRCSVEGCTKSVQSRGKCKAHGGGPRCQYEGCPKSSQGGGLCRAHGGGKRCQYEGCEKGTQRGDYCATHGGNRICQIEGCLRNSRGGNLCAAHGGGKRCEELLCRRPARKQGRCSLHAVV